MRNRYILFSGENYYARGGWHDSPQGFDSRDEALKEAEERVENDGYEWWHIVDLMNMCIVAKSENQAYGVYDD